MADMAGITEASKMLTHGTAYSSRDRVNVIIPGVGHDVGNHFYPPARGDVTDYVRARVREALDADERVRWARRPYVVTVREEPVRGTYAFTVWSVESDQVDPTEVCEVCDGFLFAGDEPGYVQVPGSGRYLPDNGVAVCSRQCGEEATANGENEG